MAVLLDRDQKAVFSRWLETQIASSKGIMEQMKKIGTPDAILQRELAEQAACAVVLRMIQSGEDVTIG